MPRDGMRWPTQISGRNRQSAANGEPQNNETENDVYAIALQFHVQEFRLISASSERSDEPETWTAVHPRMNASRSALMMSGCVANMPCDRPG